MKKIHLISSFVVLFLITSCGSTKEAVKKVDPYVGSWSLMISDTPQGDMAVTMMIFKDDQGAYKGSLSSELGNMNLSNVTIEDNKLSSTFVTQDIDFDLTGTFEENTFKGFVSGMGADFKTSGKKVVEE